MAGDSLLVTFYHIDYHRVMKNSPKTASKTQPVRIGMMSLGCPKTLVDSEIILGKLDPAKYSFVTNVGNCDVALLNTCSFINDAQKESVDRILELVELKKQKQIKALVVMGCMVQQFTGELQKELKEVDAFIGSGEYGKIPEIVEKVTGGEKVVSVGKAGYLSSASERRIALTPKYYRYLKISEGCDHICSFCTIPSFRGKHRSRKIDDVIQEAERLVSEGAKEIIVTGQDTTYFGRDFSGEFLLPTLLKELDQVKGAEWIRVLYAYPSCITQELMETIGRSKKIVHYLDMPLQHASDAMLQSMRRGITRRKTTDLIKQFRSIVPDLAIRTTFIVGFPGETDKDFEELLEFIEEMKFERLGIFRYSKEDGTHGASLPNQIPEKIKQARWESAMKLQNKVSKGNMERFIGKKVKVLIEERSQENPEWIVGRGYMDAPEIDGNVLIPTKKLLEPGTFSTVTITSSQDYDLIGELQ